MKVKELIEMLKGFDPEAIVVDYNEDDCMYFPATKVAYTNYLEKYVSLVAEKCGYEDEIKEAEDCPKMWHIYNMKHEPLCWDNEALAFDTREDAEKFLESCLTDEFEDEMPIIVEDYLYYDGGYINASNSVMKIGSNGKAYLANRE